MKLSDIRGERTLDVIADITPAVAVIAADPDAAGMFKRERVPEGKTAKEFVIEKAGRIVNLLLKSHKKEVIQILAGIEGVSYAQYAESLNLVKIMADLSDLLNDEVFLAFFTSAQSQATSGSVSENTAAQIL